MPHVDPEKSLLNYYLDRISFLIICTQLSLPFLMVFHFLANPRGAMYITSLIPEKWFAVELLICVIGGWYYLLLLQSILANVSCIANFAVLFIAMISQILNQELMPNQRSYKYSFYLRTAQNIPTVYRSIELFHKYCNETYAIMIIPEQIIITKLNIFCNYILIKHWMDIDKTTTAVLMLWIVATLTLWMVTLRFGGWLHSKGKQTVKSWRFFDWNKKDLKYISKFKKSCRPLAVRVGNVYMIDKLSELKFLIGIIVGTCRALLFFS